MNVADNLAAEQAPYGMIFPPTSRIAAGAKLSKIPLSTSSARQRDKPSGRSAASSRYGYKCARRLALPIGQLSFHSAAARRARSTGDLPPQREECVNPSHIEPSRLDDFYAIEKRPSKIKMGHGNHAGPPEHLGRHLPTCLLTTYQVSSAWHHQNRSPLDCSRARQRIDPKALQDWN